MNEESLRAIMEGERNAAADAYFKARPQLLRSIDQEWLFEAGFLRGFTAGRATAESTEAIDERCPHCGFDPTSRNDYCDKHRPV